MLYSRSTLPAFFVIIASLSLFGCATKKVTGYNNDPLEPLNRKIYTFNTFFDDTFAKPFAKGYKKYIPTFVQKGIHNFFKNLDDINVTLNDVLQGNFVQAGQDGSRFFTNSTIGIFGFIDVATDIGLKKHNEDLSQTLGYWGIEDGPYLVLPFLGPNTLRSATTGTIETFYLSPLNSIKPHTTQNALIIINLFDTRVNLFLASEMLETAALDPYSYVRESHLQRQKSLIYNGNIPLEDEPDILDGL